MDDVNAKVSTGPETISTGIQTLVSAVEEEAAEEQLAVAREKYRNLQRTLLEQESNTVELREKHARELLTQGQAYRQQLAQFTTKAV